MLSLKIDLSFPQLLPGARFFRVILTLLQFPTVDLAFLKL